MAQPKRRWSKQRTHTKRSTWKLENKTISTCKHCTADMKAAAWEIAGRNVKIEDYFV